MLLKSYLELFTCVGKDVVDTEFPQLYNTLERLMMGIVVSETC